MVLYLTKLGMGEVTMKKSNGWTPGLELPGTPKGDLDCLNKKWEILRSYFYFPLRYLENGMWKLSRVLRDCVYPRLAQPDHPCVALSRKKSLPPIGWSLMLYHNNEIASSRNLLRICLQWISLLCSCQTVKWLQPVKTFLFY